MNLILRYMTVADVPQVIPIDRLSFDLPWSQNSYAHEISEANYSHMVVLEQTDAQTTRGQGWRRWLGRLNGQQPTSKIVGYGGLWHIMSEAHISTIAVHPDYRGRGWGEILLAGMVGKAMSLKAGVVVLEVRVSNTPAQNLYRKYEFQTVGVKARYYRNNNEDAYDMRLALGQPGVQERFEERVTALHTKQDYIDVFSQGSAPNRPATPEAE